MKEDKQEFVSLIVNGLKFVRAEQDWNSQDTSKPRTVPFDRVKEIAKEGIRRVGMKAPASWISSISRDRSRSASSSAKKVPPVPDFNALVPSFNRPEPEFDKPSDLFSSNKGSD